MKQEDVDHVRRAIESSMQLGPRLTATSQDLYAAYTAWSIKQDEFQCCLRTFSMCLTFMGFRKWKSNGVIKWRGLRPLPRDGAQ